VEFDEFARRTLPGLLRYAVMLTGDRDLAQDVVQEVMVRAQARWRRIHRTHRPELYVKTMVTHEYLSWRRRWAVRSVTAVPDAQLDRPSGGDLAADPVVRTADRADVWAQLGALPRQQRAVLALRYYEGLTDAEIAEVLDCKPATVRSYATRALAALRLDITSNSESGVRR
jgi:RNA polymerase sigma-70 factor (sigma-E family)